MKLELIAPEDVPAEKLRKPLVQTDNEQEEEEPKNEWWKSKESVVPNVHAPYFPVVRDCCREVKVAELLLT